MTVLVHKQASNLSNPFIKALADAGLVPRECRRLTIDCEAGKAITIRYEVLADQRINDPGILDAVAGLKAEMAFACGGEAPAGKRTLSVPMEACGTETSFSPNKRLGCDGPRT